MNRRGFLKGILAAGVAPAVVGSGILMPVRKIWEIDWAPLVISRGGGLSEIEYAVLGGSLGQVVRELEKDLQRITLRGAFKIDQRLAQFYEQ